MVLSNVIPFKRGNQSHCFYVCDGQFQESELRDFFYGKSIFSIQSEEALRKALVFFRPSMILIRSDLSWADPVNLIAEINRISQAPIILVLKKSSPKKEETLIKKSYQAGIFDVLRLPLGRDEVKEMLELPLKLARRYPMVF